MIPMTPAQDGVEDICVSASSRRGVSLAAPYIQHQWLSPGLQYPAYTPCSLPLAVLQEYNRP
jgi:hypothetical protein